MPNQRVNFKTIIKDFLSAFNVERGIIPTLRDLLMRPEMLINHYIKKRQLIKIHKEKYYMPGRFFVTILAAISVFSIFFGENLLYPEVLPDSFKPQSDEYKKIVMMTQLISQYTMLAFFLISITPLALSTKLLFIKQKQLTLAMHFIMNIYFSTFVLLSYPLILLFVPSHIYYEQNFLIIIIYYGHALKRVFNLSLSRTILSMILLSIIVPIITFVIILPLVYVFLSTDFALNPF